MSLPICGLRDTGNDELAQCLRRVEPLGPACHFLSTRQQSRLPAM
jgi:hypothetical protein